MSILLHMRLIGRNNKSGSVHVLFEFGIFETKHKYFTKFTPESSVYCISYLYAVIAAPPTSRMKLKFSNKTMYPSKRHFTPLCTEDLFTKIPSQRARPKGPCSIVIYSVLKDASQGSIRGPLKARPKRLSLAKRATFVSVANIHAEFGLYSSSKS